MFGESRRVEDNDIIFVTLTVEIFECVLTESLVSGVAWEAPLTPIIARAGLFFKIAR